MDSSPSDFPPFGLGQQPGWPESHPEPTFPDAPPWFRHLATEARKLLNSPLGRDQCQANVKAGVVSYGKNLKPPKLFPGMDERP